MPDPVWGWRYPNLTEAMIWDRQREQDYLERRAGLESLFLYRHRTASWDAAAEALRRGLEGTP